MSTAERNQQLFASVVAMFHLAAMQQMGKIKNPLTDAIDRNLDAARETIDILDMLKSKTRGNLSGEEERLLGQVLQELKLNFVDETSKPPPEPPPSGEPDADRPSPSDEGAS